MNDSVPIVTVYRLLHRLVGLVIGCDFHNADLRLLIEFQNATHRRCWKRSLRAGNTQSSTRRHSLIFYLIIGTWGSSPLTLPRPELNLPLSYQNCLDEWVKGTINTYVHFCITVTYFTLFIGINSLKSDSGNRMQQPTRFLYIYTVDVHNYCAVSTVPSLSLLAVAVRHIH